MSGSNDTKCGHIDVTLIRENEDGSADFMFHLTDEYASALLTYGIKCAIEAGIEEGKKWMTPEDAIKAGCNDEDS
jgi:hypothetical protein